MKDYFKPSFSGARPQEATPLSDWQPPVAMPSARAVDPAYAASVRGSVAQAMAAEPKTASQPEESEQSFSAAPSFEADPGAALAGAVAQRMAFHRAHGKDSVPMEVSQPSVQMVKDVDIPGGGMCGPAALLPIIKGLGKEVDTVADIVGVLTGQEDKAGSVVGEIFNKGQMNHVLSHYGLTATYRDFNSASTFWEALGSTGSNYTMVAISNVGFDNLGRDMDRALIEAGNEWVRAHWIIITAKRETGESEARERFVTYTESQNRAKREVKLETVMGANAKLNAEWDWEKWSSAYGRTPSEDASVGAARAKREVPEGKIAEALQLSGYVVEITAA